MGDDDPIARLRAQMDQSRESMKEFAGTLWAFYGQLVEEGFKADQALALTVTMITATLHMPPRPEGTEE